MSVGRGRAILRTGFSALFVMAVGTAGYMSIEGMSVVESLYMTSITVTTVGFKEVVPLSPPGQVFTIFLAFAGVGVILFSASEIAHVIFESDLRRVLGRRREVKMLRRLNNHIVVGGYGRMGEAVVDVLKERNVPFVVVELDSEACVELENGGISYIQGDVTQEEVMRRARLDRARTFLSCLSDDAHNVYAILLARQLQPNITVIARAVEEEAEERLRLAGADRVINPYRLGGMRLALTAIRPAVMDFVEASLPGGRELDLELAEIPVAETSEVAGRTLAAAEVRKRFGIIVVSLKRGDQSYFNPGPDEVMMTGDTLIVLGTPQAVQSMESACR
jgi:voltage-gated potassium channel